MSYKQQIDKSKGFTIIEVLIVLAIAGLILLIVFLAVPALQRSARNTQRKNDVSAMLGAMSEYANNNGGALPDTTAIATGTVTFSNSTATADATSSAKVGYYTAAPAIVVIGGGGTGTLPTAYTTDTVTIYEGTTCSGNLPVAGSASAYTAEYGVEQAGGHYAPQCVE